MNPFFPIPKPTPNMGGGFGGSLPFRPPLPSSWNAPIPGGLKVMPPRPESLQERILPEKDSRPQISGLEREKDTRKSVLPKGLDIKTGSAFVGVGPSSLHRKMSGLLKKNRSTLSHIDAQERAFFENLVQGWTAKLPAGSEFSSSVQRRMKREVWLNSVERGGYITPATRKIFDKWIDTGM